MSSIWLETICASLHCGCSSWLSNERPAKDRVPSYVLWRPNTRRCPWLQFLMEKKWRVDNLTAALDRGLLLSMEQTCSNMQMCLHYAYHILMGGTCEKHFKLLRTWHNSDDRPPTAERQRGRVVNESVVNGSSPSGLSVYGTSYLIECVLNQTCGVHGSFSLYITCHKGSRPWKKLCVGGQT